MANLDSTGVSCGVDMFAGFGETWRPQEPQDIFRDLCKELKQAMRDNGERNKFQCKFIVFSDVAGQPGDLFGQYLKERFPDQPITELRGVNPNSGNAIVLYTWELPSVKTFRSTPEWKAVKTVDYSKEWY